MGLAQAGLDVAVVGPVGGGGRWNALLPRAERFLTRIGLDPQNPDVGGTPITGLVSVEGQRAVRFDALDADLPTMGVAVDGGAIARTAIVRTPKCGVQVKAESKERASGKPAARSLFGRVGRSFDQASSWVKSLFAKPAATG